MKIIITPFAVILFITYLQAQVPAEWDTAKTELTAKLNSVNAAIQTKWDGQEYCTNFGANLLLANSNQGYKLFSSTPPSPPVPSYQNALFNKVDTMLIAFDMLGFEAVDITIQYPLLVNSFPNQQYYLDFYQAVVQKAKQRGFQITIGCQATFVDSTVGEAYMVKDILQHYFNPDNNILTDDTLENIRFRQEKLQMMQTIIDSLAPDYLTMEMEPQTQQINLFNLVDYSIDSTLAHINFFTSNLSASTTLLGAGAGSWDDLGFFENMVQSNIDFIDYHIYPPHFDAIDNKAFLIDSLADANGKKLIIGEAWCYKATESEMTNISDPVATSTMIYSRDIFDYWEAVDTLFVKAMVNLSQQSKIEVVSFFWSTILFGQITYNPSIHGSMSYAEILNVGQQAGYDNMSQLILSPVGLYTQSECTKICPTSSVNELNNISNIFIFPNPASTHLNISTDRKIEKLSVFDITGNLIVQYQQPKHQITLPENLSHGIYFLQLKMSNESIFRKLVVNN